MEEETTYVDDESTPLSPSDEETGSEEPTESEDNAPGKKSAEARINELISKNKKLEGKLRTIEDKMAPPPEPSREEPATPQMQKATETLKEMGFVQSKELDEKVRAVEDRQILNSEHQRLVIELNGSDGRPKYDKGKVEEYMRTHGIYDPEAAYKLLNEAELLDWQLKKAEQSAKKRPYAQRPGSSTGRQEDQAITREKIADAQKTPAGREWYEKNRKKILQMMQAGQL